jgi:hypothetical protein
MRIGDLSGEISPEINNLGFSFRDKITLLGFTLQNYGDITAANFERVMTKIDTLIRFWERFFLSLPGKIVVYKTFLIPQINYLAAVLTPGAETIQTLEEKMAAFVTKGFNLSKNKIYAPVREGGLGLFNLKDFISSLQCNWIKRSYRNITDNWKYRLATTSGGNILDLAPDRKTIDNSGTVLNNIISSFCFFKQQFTKMGNNFLTVPFYCNASFGYGRGYKKLLDDDFFNCIDDDRLRGIYRTSTWKILTNDRDGLTLKPRVEINQSLGTTLTPNQYNIMVKTLRNSTKRYYKEGEKSISLNDFMNTFKKGFKYFRKIISHWDPRLNLEKTTQVKTFLQLIDCQETNTVRLRALYTSWNNHYFNSNLRVFLFKYYNNILGLNSRVSHFNPDINGACTFCSIAGFLPAPKESFIHLFYDCAVVNKVLNDI